ncbi:MAG: YqhA family protein [Bacteroidota bacterium]
MKLLEYVFKGVGVIVSIILFIMGLSVMLYACYDGFLVINKILFYSTKESSVIYGVMGVLDLILLSFSIFITSIGIYELFVKPLENLPQWIQVKDLDALKAMLIKIIIVVMSISFMGKVITWNGEDNILTYGVSIGAVTLALSYFLSVKTKH